MIPKVSRGADMGGLIRYLLGPGKENEHTNPHLVAGHDGVMGRWGRDALPRSEAHPIAHELDAPHRIWGTEIGGGHVWQCSLSLRADEGRLTDERWGDIAREFVEGMGFVGDGVDHPCRWAAVHHGPSAAGNDHIHVVVGLVREDGSRARTSFDHRRVRLIATELEQRHGLRVLGSAKVGQRGLSRMDVERQRRGEEPLRWRLERTVRAVAAQSSTEAEFARGLRSAGLVVRPHWAKGGQSINGYAVAIRPGKGERGPVFMGGGQLAADLSLPRLRMSHRDEWSGEASAVGVRAWVGWRGERGQEQRQPVARPAVTDERVAGYAAEYRVLRERMAQVAPGDVATWAAVSHELAGVLSAWSLAAEGSRPGPLAEAARAVARGAQVPAHVAGQAGRVPSLRGSSMILASAAVGGRGPVGRAVLLRQIVATTRMVHDARVSERHADEALRLAALADGQFAAVRSMLPSPELSAKVAAQYAEQGRQSAPPAFGWCGAGGAGASPGGGCGAVSRLREPGARPTYPSRPSFSRMRRLAGVGCGWWTRDDRGRGEAEVRHPPSGARGRPGPRDAKWSERVRWLRTAVDRTVWRCGAR